MGSVIVLALLAGVGFTALVLPWVGVAGAYLIGILNPQAIWWWSFEGVRPVYWVLLPTLLGVTVIGVRGKLRWEALANVRVLCLLVIWLTGMLSWWLGPYSLTNAAEGEHSTRAASFIMENLSKIVLLTIVAILCVKTPQQLRVMAVVMLVSGLYLTWWINDRYLFNGAWGRIGGPTSIYGSGTYSDENFFGTLFVATFPFAWYAAFSIKRYWARLALLLSVPFIWHGVFLTGSRGALLALGASMLVIVMRMKRRSLGIAVVVLFAGAFVWQAGDTMKNRAASIDEYSEDASATGRVDAWKAGVRMMAANPLTGVGPGAFLRAFAEFSEKQPRQAHNTLVQFGAEFGPIALVAIAVLLVSCIASLWKIVPDGLSEAKESTDPDLYVREASLAAVVGVTVSGVFLSLQLFEVMYFLVFMSSALIANHQERLASEKIQNQRYAAGLEHPYKEAGPMLIPARRKQTDQGDEHQDRL
jgi:putative inorganic carbon (HCO3(-)) transporter